MKSPDDNMAPGQQHFPDENGDLGRESQSAEEIIDGAHQEDQLESLNQQAEEEPSTNHAGAAPTAYQYERQENESETGNADTSNTTNNNEPHDPLATQEGRSNGATPAALSGGETEES